MPWDDSGDYIRSGHNSPDDYSTCRTIDVSAEQGIKAIYCQRKDEPGKWEIQSYLFDKKKWGMDRAKAWFGAHNKGEKEMDSANETAEKMHPDFEKILAQFIKRYGPEGKEKYHAWLVAMGLNDTKPYGSQTEGKNHAESFSWAAPILDASKADENYSYWKVEAAFPLTSMNGNIYTEDELKAATRTLIGKEVNMNHEPPPFPKEEVEIIDAEYEGGATECIVRVKHGSELEKKLKGQEVISVSIQGGCRNRKEEGDGVKCEGMVFSGLAFLDKGRLPGIPLTRIMSAEAIAESVPNSSPSSSMKAETEEKAKAESSKEKAESPTKGTLETDDAIDVSPDVWVQKAGCDIPAAQAQAQEKEEPPAQDSLKETPKEKIEVEAQEKHEEATPQGTKESAQTEKADAGVEVEECECILKNLPNSYYERQRQYHKDGLSLKDSWRKATQELLTAIDRKQKKDAQKEKK